MDITKVTNEISSPALKELAQEILGTVDSIKTGKKKHMEGLAELNGYKQVIQIMALEVMRHRLPIKGAYEMS